MGFEICRSGLRKFIFCSNWPADIVDGKISRELQARALEIPSIRRDVRKVFFYVPLLMRGCSYREEIEVNTEWELEDNNQALIRSVGGDTGRDETRADGTVDEFSLVWRCGISQLPRGSTAQGVYLVCHENFNAVAGVIVAAMLHHSAPWEREKDEATFVTPSSPLLVLLSALTVDEDVTVRSSPMQSMCQWLQPLKPSINTWREREPNKWEPILLRYDILTWRSHMFQVIKTTFSWSDAKMLACMHDGPWSVIKLVHFSVIKRFFQLSI
ncbi:hypothetical protein PsorP6_002445 [Peronosclerospora sorghi]|uniref:Uncharacterized protein n=1 Tax=Peronosclerospora sorghi TaxID=230839 RepID=A0ACC0WQN9_9STRA|nr:hypothetical protein PsorP6_002445 [Peronosclerospora sorghi]